MPVPIRTPGGVALALDRAPYPSRAIVREPCPCRCRDAGSVPVPVPIRAPRRGVALSLDRARPCRGRSVRAAMPGACPSPSAPLAGSPWRCPARNRHRYGIGDANRGLERVGASPAVRRPLLRSRAHRGARCCDGEGPLRALRMAYTGRKETVDFGARGGDKPTFVHGYSQRRATTQSPLGQPAAATAGIDPLYPRALPVHGV